MAIFGILDQSNYTIPGFLPDGESLRLPEGARIAQVDKDGRWALYVHDSLNLSWIATKAIYKGVLGWKIRSFTSIVSIQWLKSYIKSCNQCLESL